MISFWGDTTFSYQQVPTFGHDTIQHFCSNSSEMKKMAARDFKDLLLVWLPFCFVLSLMVMLVLHSCLDKLLPEPHNTLVMTLLFLLCHWQVLAKLCMHTDDTLRLMELITVKLGNHLRTFTNETCSAFSTKELHCEAEAQTRCQGHETLRELGNASS